MKFISNQLWCELKKYYLQKIQILDDQNLTIELPWKALFTY